MLDEYTASDDEVDDDEMDPSTRKYNQIYQSKGRQQQNIDQDVNRVTLYNPYATRIKPPQLQKLKIKVSGSALYDRPPVPLFNGGKLLRKIKPNEAIKNRHL